MSTFTREDRYIVIKRADLDCLSKPELVELEMVLARISKQRADANKRPLQCVVIEDDWPEYETVWSMIQARMEQQ